MKEVTIPEIIFILVALILWGIIDRLAEGII